MLLVAIALDWNNGLFPIAVGVVESEGRDSWAFFIDHLHTVIGAGTHARAWTFMSDQQKVYHWISYVIILFSLVIHSFTF